MDEEKEYQEYEEQHLSRGAILIRRSLSIAWRVLIFGIIAIVLWRVLFSDRIPKAMSTLTPNDTLAAAYAGHGEKLQVLTQDFDPVEMDNKEVAGYFWVCEAVYLPEAEQLQILVRYNKSTLEKTAKDFKLDAVPGREECIIDVTLLIQTETNTEDEDTSDRVETRVYATGVPVGDMTSMYNYYRYTFDGVTLNEATLVDVSVQFYYIDMVNYDRSPWSTLSIFRPELETVDIGLSARDIKALEQYGSK